MRLSLQNKHLGNSGIIILWEPVPVFCLLLFLVFQTKEWQLHPVILNTFSWLPPPQLRPVFLLAAAVPTECCCWPRCRAARFYRWHSGDWETLRVHWDLWAVSCLTVTFLASRTPSSIRFIFLKHLSDHVSFLADAFSGSSGCWNKALPRPHGPGKVTPVRLHQPVYP